MYEKITNLDYDLLGILGSLWNFHLFDVDKSPITLGKIIIGICLVVTGYFASRIASRAVSQRMISRLKIQKSLQYALERLAFYLVYIFLILFVLQMLSIPVTIFAMIGSALAIGIGFGSQNVVNNFISGLIVMIEQPIRVGDWVEIDGIFGQVEQIGSRSTYILTADNKQIIIPNSIFLEKMFVNWTLNDNIIGGRLSVGVAYGSDTQLVKKLLLQAASEHSDVLKSIHSIVFFKDFAESSLGFELLYWVGFTETISPATVASDLRFRIDELFRENGVSMPFPHRELVFSNQRPISVQIHQ